MDSIFKKDTSGAPVSPNEAGYDKLIEAMMDDMKTATEMNTGYRTPEEVRDFMARILGKQLPESSTVLTPFYIDYGKNTRIGENCWIQQCCTFFERCGITIGNGVFIGPKCNLITSNHLEDLEERSTTYGAPIVLEDRYGWVST